MNRRELLKIGVASPLLGLVEHDKDRTGKVISKPLTKNDICNDALKKIHENETTAKWARACAEEMNRNIDELILRSIGA